MANFFSIYFHGTWNSEIDEYDEHTDTFEDDRGQLKADDCHSI